MRNYITIFLIGAVCAILSTLISILLIDEEKDTEMFEFYFPDPTEVEDSEKESQPSHHHSKIVAGPQTEKNTQQKSALKILFDLHNVREMVHTFVRPRPHHIRRHIIMLVFAALALLVAYVGPAVFLYQYVQKLYAWNSATYANYTSLGAALNIITSFAISPLLLNVSHTCSTILNTQSNFLSSLIGVQNE